MELGLWQKKLRNCLFQDSTRFMIAVAQSFYQCRFDATVHYQTQINTYWDQRSMNVHACIINGAWMHLHALPKNMNANVCIIKRAWMHMYALSKEYEWTCMQYQRSMDAHACIIKRAWMHMYALSKEYEWTCMQYQRSMDAHACITKETYME